MKRVCIFLIATLLTASVWAMTPPRYLSVPGWKMCMKTIAMRRGDLICVPDYKPKRCDYSSWQALNKLARRGAISYCEEGIGSDNSGWSDDRDRPIGSEAPIGSAPGMGSSAPMGAEPESSDSGQ